MLIFSQVFVAIGRNILGFLSAVKRWKAECQKKEFLDICKMMANMTETLFPTICEMARNGVSVSFDVTALFRSAQDHQSKRKELSHSIKKKLLALLKMALTALLKALLNIAAKALLEKLF